MTRDKYLITAIILAAVMFSAAGAAAMSVIAETQTTSNAEYPVCTAPCECITESDAAMRWGAEGYGMCSKSICGQTADAMVQYYCIHPTGSATTPTVVITAAATATAQETVQAPVTSVAADATTPITSPPAAAPTQRAAACVTAIPAMISAVLLAAAGMWKK